MRGVLAVVLLTIGFYWKVSLTNQYVWFDHPDMAMMELPRLEFMAREIHTGRFPLWDPHIWMGQPLIGQTQPGPLNPLNIAFLMLPLRDGYLRTEFLNWYFVVMHIIAALGAYALCRDLRRSRPAAVLGACLYSFGGFLGGVPWLDVMSGALWTPLICLFFLRAARGVAPVSNGALSGLFLGIAWLSGHHEIPMLTTVALGVAWLWVLWQQRSAAALVSAAITFVSAGLIAAAQLWPTVEFGRLSMRWGPPGPGPVGWKDTVTYLSSEMYTLTTRGLAGLLFPGQGTIGDSSGFFGTAGVMLALLGLYCAWRIRPVRWFTVLGGVAVVYALGAITPLHGFIYGAVPGFDKARLPVRALLLAGLALAVLAAYGFDQFLHKRGDRVVRRAAVLIGLTSSAAVAALAAGKLSPSPSAGIWAYCAIAASCATLAWYSAKIGRSWAVAIVFLAMLTELQSAFTLPWQNRYAENGQRFARMLTDHRDIADFLRTEPAPRRVVVNDQDIPANFGDIHSIDMLEGYLAGVAENLLHHPRHTVRGQNLYGVTHFVSRQPGRDDLVQVFEGQGGVKVFRASGALPRVRTVHDVGSVENVNHLAPAMDRPDFDAARTVVLVGDTPQLESCTGDTVQLEAYAPNRVRARAAMACRGMVILSDTFYPGWKAFVDGRAAHIWAAYGSLRGVVLEAGAHEIDFRYKPVSVFAGLALSAAGFLLVAGIVVSGRFSARKRSSTA